jgi:hypothetical protein
LTELLRVATVAAAVANVGDKVVVVVDLGGSGHGNCLGGGIALGSVGGGKYEYIGGSSATGLFNRCKTANAKIWFLSLIT